jgi:hypothetical protein
LTAEIPLPGPAARGRPRWLWGLAAVAVAAGAALVAHLATRSFGPREDAYISYSYARNLAAGQGWVFFPGEEPTYGSTSPLFVLLLAAARLLGADIPAAGHTLQLVATAGTVLLIFLIGSAMGSPTGGLLGGLLFGLHGQIPYLISGMETALVLLLSAALILLYLRGQLVAAGIVSGLLVLARPDAVLLAALLLCHLLATRGRRAWRALLPAFAVILPWYVYAWRTFGSLLPNPVVAKQLAGSRVFAPLSWSLFVYHFLPISWTGLVAVALALAGVGALWLGRKDSAWTAAIAWPALYFLALWIAGAPSFGVYYVPPLLVVWIAVGHGLAALPGPPSGSPLRRRAGALVAAAAALFLTLALVRGTGETMREGRESRHRVVPRLARWLRAQAPPGSRVCAFEVGHLGYFSGCNVIDLLGLTTRRTWPWLKRCDFLGAVRALEPDYVVALDAPDWLPAEQLLGSDWFERNYHEVYSLPYLRRVASVEGKVVEARPGRERASASWRRERYAIYARERAAAGPRPDRAGK